MLEHWGPEITILLTDEDGPTEAVVSAEFANRAADGGPVPNRSPNPAVAVRLDIHGSLQLTAEQARTLAETIASVAATITAHPDPLPE